MNYRRYSELRSEARAAFDAVEDWMDRAFGGSFDEAMAELDSEDLEAAVSTKRRGMRYFAGGRARDQRLFASILFPLFHGDRHLHSHREAIIDILRVAGGQVAAKSRHKLSFDLGVLYFTADARGS